MANSESLKFLIECSKDSQNGDSNWNEWRKINDVQTIDLSNANLSGITLHKYNLAGIDFTNTNLANSILLDSELIYSNFTNADLRNANLSRTRGQGTNFQGSNLDGVIMQFSQYSESNFRNSILINSKLAGGFFLRSNFQKSNFKGADLITATFAGSDLSYCDLRECHFSGVNISNTSLAHSDISGSKIFGISAWNVNKENLKQAELIITNDQDNIKLTVDDIEIAQFIYLLSKSEKLSSVIDRITSKVVLVLGRFTDERKKILDAIKMELRKHDYISVVFDFNKPENRDLTETIGLIGRMAKFIVADLTDAKSIPQELGELVPHNPSIVIQPIILEGNNSYSMFEHWTNYPWVLPIVNYSDEQTLIKNIKVNIIDPVEKHLIKKKPEDL